MSLKASVLKSNESQRKALNKEIRSILGSIDDELKSAHERGEHSVSISLPITFSIPYMSNKDAQREIYYGILQSLKEREFTVSVYLGNDKTIFNIKWLSAEEETEMELKQAELAKHSSEIRKK